MSLPFELKLIAEVEDTRDLLSEALHGFNKALRWWKASGFDSEQEASEYSRLRALHDQLKERLETEDK